MSFRTVGRRGYDKLFSKNYTGYVTNLGLDLWLRLKEPSGNPVNSGGLSLTITQANCTHAQTGKLGVSEAYDFNGTTSVITITNHATLANMSTQKWGFLYFQDTVGEASAARWFNWGNGGAANVNYLGNVATNKIDCVINLDGTDARAITAQTDSILNNWQWVFVDYDHNNTLGNGKRIRIFQGLNKQLTQLTLLTNNAGVGNTIAMADNLGIGNGVNANLTLDARLDEVFCKASSLWTLSEMQSIINLSGV